MPVGNVRAALMPHPAAPATVQWVQSVIAAGGSVTQAEFAGISRFERVDKSAGYWTLRGALGIHALQSQIAAETCLIRRVRITATASPVFVPGKGLLTNGSSSYYDMAYNPTSVGIGSATDQALSIRELKDLAANTTAMGAITTSGTNEERILPRSAGNALIFRLDSADATTASFLNSSEKIVTVTRSGSTFASYVDGVLFGSPAPTTGSSRSNKNYFLGCANGTSGATLFRANLFQYHSVSSAPSATPIAGAAAGLIALFNSLPPADTFADFTGGSDTAAGTAAAPVKTLSVAMGLAQSRGWIYFAGTVGTPLTYTASPSATISKSNTFKATNALGVILAGAGSVQCFGFTPAVADATATFDGVKVDAASNTGGTPAGRCITANVASITGRLRFIGASVIGWTGAGAAAVYGNGTNFRGFIDVINSTFSGVDVGSCILMLNSIAGGFYSSGSTYTITQQNTLIVGAVNWGATVPGTTFESHSDTINITIRADIADGSYHYGMQAVNVDNAYIKNLTVNFDCNGTPVTAQGVSLQYSPTLDAGSASCSNGLLEDCTVTFSNANTNVGGILVGAEASLTPSKSVGNIIRRGTVVGTGVGHGVFLGYQSFGQMLSCTCNDVDLNLLLKGGNDNLMESCTAANATSAVILVKGEANSIVRGNTATQHAGSTGDLIRIEDNDTLDPVVHSTGISVTGNTFTADNTTVAVVVRANNTATFTSNVYNVSNGGTITFSYQGSTLTPTQWRAQIEPTATGNIF